MMWIPGVVFAVGMAALVLAVGKPRTMTWLNIGISIALGAAALVGLGYGLRWPLEVFAVLVLLRVAWLMREIYRPTA